MSPTHNLDILDAEGRDLERWLALIEGCPDAPVFAHPEYLRLFAGDAGRPILATWTDGRARVLQPLLLRDLRATPFWDGEPLWDTVGPPFGWAGPFVHGEGDRDAAVEAFFQAYAAWARSAGIVSEYVTLDPTREAPVPYPGDVEVKMPTVVVDTRGETFDDVWMRYKGTTRTRVRKTWKSGLTCEADFTGEHLDDFLAIYRATMDRNVAGSTYRLDRELLERFNERLRGHYVYFHCREEGRIISTELALVSGDSTFFFRGGTYGDRLSTAANVRVKDEIIRWTWEQGRSFYVQGGGNSADLADPLLRYKLTFQPKGGLRDLRVGKWRVDPERYERVLEARRAHEAASGRAWAPRPGFFPAYRAPAAADEEAA